MALEDITVERAGTMTPVLAGQPLLKGDIAQAGTGRLSGADFGLAYAKSIKSTASKTALQGQITRLQGEETAAAAAGDKKLKARKRAERELVQRDLNTTDERAAVAAAFVIEANKSTGTRDVFSELGSLSGINYKYAGRTGALEENIKYATEMIS